MVIVISSDTQLHRMSKEVLADLGQGHLLATPDPQLESVDENDICILDWSEAFTTQGRGAELKGLHLYVVDREEVGALPAVLPAPTIGILLKPVNRSALRVSLEQAIGATGSRVLRRAGGVDRDDMLQSLLNAYLRLQEHENDRAAFLARVLHDFRAPLTAINGYCGLFLEDALGPLRPRQREALLRMHRSATRLSRLAISLFELTVHDRVGSDPRMSEGSIRLAAEQAVDEVRSTCQDRDIAVSVDLEEPDGSLFFDGAQVEQVLVNLLENAIRFTPRHGVVELRGYADGQGASRRYRVDVRDYGPPIAADVLPLIFEEYYSISQACDRSSGGLGLAICKLIVRAHSGSIWASSGPEGTVFSFVLPFRARDNLSLARAAGLAN